MPAISYHPIQHSNAWQPRSHGMALASPAKTNLKKEHVPVNIIPIFGVSNELNPEFSRIIRFFLLRSRLRPASEPRGFLGFFWNFLGIFWRFFGIFFQEKGRDFFLNKLLYPSYRTVSYDFDSTGWQPVNGVMMSLLCTFLLDDYV